MNIISMKVYKKVNSIGTIGWFNENHKLHREDGPAVIYTDDSCEWWICGKRHREDGAAIIRSSGHKEWWMNGQRHRDDGPARQLADGSKEWWINGVKLTQTEFLARNSF